MNYSDLKNFLSLKITASVFEEKIRYEVVNFKNNLLNKKYGEVILNYSENEKMIIDENHFRTLCNAYLANDIGEYEMYYISDAIMLSNHFQFINDEVEDLFFQITDPEVNGVINKETVLELLFNLDNK